MSIVDRAAISATSDMAADSNMDLEELDRLWKKLQAEVDELLSERGHYSDFFERAPEPHLVTDGYGRIEQANAAAAGLLGMPSLELVRKPLVAFVPLGARAAFRRGLNQLASKRALRDWPCELVSRRGERKTMSASVREMLGVAAAARYCWLLRTSG